MNFTILPPFSASHCPEPIDLFDVRRRTFFFASHVSFLYSDPLKYEIAIVCMDACLVAHISLLMTSIGLRFCTSSEMHSPYRCMPIGQHKKKHKLQKQNTRYIFGRPII